MVYCSVCRGMRIPHGRLFWGINEYVLCYSECQARLYVPLEILKEEIVEEKLKALWDRYMHDYFCIRSRCLPIRKEDLIEVLEAVAYWVHTWGQRIDCSESGQFERTCILI